MTKSVKTLFIVGPTASGKSALALQLAQELDGEIICADSQTVRRELNIGTAKPSLKDQKKVRHHLLDIIGPYDDYSAAQFKNDAEKALEDVHNRGKVAIVVGGTGLYIDALFYNYAFSGVPADSKVRMELSGNPRHVADITKDGQLTPRPNSLIIGLQPAREEVVERIGKRVDTVFEQGFIEEVHQLVKKYGPPPRTFDAIAYRYGYEYTLHLCSLAETKEQIVIAERQFAKRQVTWFKRNPHIKWFETADAAHDFVRLEIKIVR